MTSDRVTDLSVKEKEKEKKLPHAKNTWKIHRYSGTLCDFRYFH